MESTLLTPQEVAKRLRVSYGMVMLLIHRRQLAAIKVTPKLFRVEPKAVDEFMVAHAFTGVQDKEGDGHGLDSKAGSRS